MSQEYQDCTVISGVEETVSVMGCSGELSDSDLSIAGLDLGTSAPLRLLWEGPPL